MPETATHVLKKGQVEKYIWGHRLYDEQDGMMTFLEFLCVLNYLPLDKPENSCQMALKDYRAPVRRLLRSLVFNNPYIDELRANTGDEWKLWQNRFNANKQTKAACGKNEGLAQVTDERLSNLQRLFPGRDGFRQFSDTIRLLRSAGINRVTNKRWTSNFIFPWGRHCLFLDLSASGNITDRRFFGRNGELLYLLLSHAERHEELAKLIDEKILSSGHYLDTICQELSCGSNDIQDVAGVSRGSGCLLPAALDPGSDLNVATKRRVNVLCEDLITVFRLPIPAPDAVRHATRIITLNLLCYFLEQARHAIEPSQEAKPMPILCEALQKPSSDLRRCSRELFKENESLSLNAVRAFYEKHAENVPSAALVGESADSEGIDEDSANDDPRESEALELILQTHRTHWAGIHRVFAKDCGLASRICTRDFRYAPSDDLLETLAAVLVPKKRLLLADFLKSAYERYGLVFGKTECGRSALSAAGQLDEGELNSNQRRLVRRLSALGLLAWLSDGFEFVLNPYSRI